MNHIEDASTLAVAWWKSSASGTQSDCVEFGVVDDQSVAVRDSKNPTGPALLLTREQAVGFVSAAREGRFVA
ncbi:DUF397 domain-containing protein [Streptomyces montanisoli]|uniref:DUF397 domain-containing protein n=1 Tax=Streptomyces montanisoli TaxID=2798581 RepID=A0A940RVN7_9ACTN|nr:DUF397 domain-containing protein [Streptomyces montanisoli]MBP0456263.1 DUF397 domain-containing protein [Streptomyces montanisoli]